ncbi:MAG TPA: aminotransferase class III-fold pyridoxal phosphate-dependent enzyme, partial [Bacteroidetes bacterium]|nr:aminotransferase class III-fold pyridoxal phosphate-dependent enzyme [Bacteroidota bacterium]
VELAERLLGILPSNQSSVFYSDNGSTAVEVALKMAIQYWENKKKPKKGIVAFKDAYHGDTFGAMAVSGRGAFVKPFESMLFDVQFIDAPTPGKEKDSLAQLEIILDNEKLNIGAFIY